jgi:hypothetical protein
MRLLNPKLGHLVGFGGVVIPDICCLVDEAALVATGLESAEPEGLRFRVPRRK